MRILKLITVVCVVLLGVFGLVLLLKSGKLSQEIAKIISPSASQPGPRLVTITSDIDSVSVKITKQQWLADKLMEADVWGKDRIVFFKPTGFQRRMVTANSLEIHLTDQVQPLGQTVSILPDGSDYIYQAYGMDYDSGTSKLTLTLFVHPEIIKKEPAETLAGRYIGVFWSTIFDITHPLKPEHIFFEERLIGKEEFLKTHLKFPKNLFILVTK